MRYLLLILVFCLSAQLAQASFGVDLRLGDRGADVSALQKALGVIETGYFGLLTKQAVMDFQQKYASEVLFPAGLSQSTGFVGQLTRFKLNNLSLIVQTQNKIDIKTGAVSRTPVIEKIVPDHGPYGAEFTIVGKNFTNANDILTTYVPFRGVASADGTTIKLTFVNPPFEKLQQLRDAGKKVADLDLPFFIFVVNQNGTSTEPGKYTIEIRKH